MDYFQISKAYHFVKVLLSKKIAYPLSSLKDPIIIRLNSFQSIIIDITDPKANFVKTAKGYLILSIVLLLLTSYIFIFMMRSTLRENRFVAH
jgi:hypothetical protein